MSKKKPRFFCDHCAREVDRNTKVCPYCGRFFASVRCPACGFTGDEQDFLSGCPSCGYSSPSSSVTVPSAELPEKKIPAQPLPLWVYIFSICAFIGICAILYFTLFR